MDFNMKINDLNLSDPIGVGQVDWSRNVNISTILCPFIRSENDKCVFSSDIRFYSKTEGEHFIDQDESIDINPKFILLTLELPLIIEKLKLIGVEFTYTVYIADELNTLMRRYIESSGDKALDEIEKSRWLMLASVKKALEVALKGQNIKINVFLTSQVQPVKKSIDDLYSKLLNENFRAKFIRNSEKEYAELVRYWRRLSGLNGNEFEKMILRDQVAYRAVMGEVMRKNGNPLIFSGQPPEPGDYFHGIMQKKVLPTMHVFKNVEGVDAVMDIISKANLSAHMKKFVD